MLRGASYLLVPDRMLGNAVKLREEFNKIDTDGNGKISVEELLRSSTLRMALINQGGMVIGEKPGWDPAPGFSQALLDAQVSSMVECAGGKDDEVSWDSYQRVLAGCDATGGRQHVRRQQGHAGGNTQVWRQPVLGQPMTPSNDESVIFM